MPQCDSSVFGDNRIVTKGYLVLAIRRHKSFWMWYSVVELLVPDVMKSRRFVCPECRVIQDVEEEDIVILTNSGTTHIKTQHQITESLRHHPHPH